MLWFKTKQKEKIKTVTAEMIEQIEPHQKERKKAVKQSHDSYKRLQSILDENHFTIKIFNAAGGKKKARVTH